MMPPLHGRHRRLNITFHGIGPQERPVERGESDYWISAAQFTALLDALEGRTDVSLSFDDGNRSDVLYGLPELLRRGRTATFFVVAERIGRTGFLNAGDIVALAEAGMSIGSHGMKHRPWRALDDAGLHEELVQARHVIESVVSCPVLEAACPFGAYDRRVLRTLRRTGYRRVYTSDGGHAAGGGWLQARNSVRSSDGAEWVAEIDAPPTPWRAVLSTTKRTAKRLR
jgi:peptidoglycan/xylan/chitin deacetylase (PgdA/CDA1 family)